MPAITNRYEQEGVVSLEISNPRLGNVMDNETQKSLLDKLEEFKRRDTVRCIILKGDPSGGAFCTGADVRNSVFEDQEGSVRTSDIAEKIDGVLHEIVRCIAELETPVISKVDGPVLGAGCGIALACDLTLASERSEFGLIYIQAGISQNAGTSYLLPRLIGVKRAKELAMLGERVKAPEAEEIGMINRAVPREFLDAEVERISRNLSSGPAKAIGKAKKLMNYGAKNDLDSTLKEEARVQSQTLDSQEMHEVMDAAYERRKPDFG